LQSFVTLNIPEHPNVLSDAVFIDLDFIGPKVRDGMVMLVADHEIKKDFPRGRVNHRATAVAGGGSAGLSE
jgi:hypothetical protein